jgi:Tol biopolymer transport system component
LNAATGEITGTPTATGTFTFTIQVTDTRNQSSSQEFTVAVADPADPRVERVSLANDGSQANSSSGTPALNEDGRFVAFTSFADNLVADDTNGFPDVFVRDRNCSTTSVAGDGTEANSQSFSPALSSVNSGTLFVVYASDADNLVPADTNVQRDVFVTALDVSSCAATVQSTVRASVATDGTEGDGSSQLPAISATGLVVSYASDATTLAPADSNNASDAFVTELSFAGGVLAVTRTRRVSLFPGRLAVGIPPTMAEADLTTETTIGNSMLTLVDNEHVGRLAFISSGVGVNQFRDIIANDATTLTVDPAWETVPDDTSEFRIIAKEEFAVESFTETTVGNSTLAMVQDESVGLIIEITAGTGAGQQRLVTANDETTFTIDPAWDELPDASSRFRPLVQGTNISTRARLSADGALVVFDSSSQFELEDTNSVPDVFLYDLATGSAVRVTLDPSGELTSGSSDGGSLDASGNLLLFRTLANDFEVALAPTLADIFSETTIGNTTLTLTPDAHVDQRVEIVEGAGVGLFRTITANTETTLTVDPEWTTVPDATSVFRILPDNNGAADLFVRNLSTGVIERVSVATDGSGASGGSDLDARMSAGGQLVAFATTADNLDAGDRNRTRDVYLRDRQAGETRRMSLALGGTNPNSESIDPALSFDGSTVAFSSTADNLIADDDNEARDVFLVDTGVIDAAPSPAPLIATAQLRSARRGETYGAELSASGGTRPLLWVVTSGELPAGLFLDSASGKLTGIPRQAGRYRFTLTVLDASRPMRRAQQTLTLTVSE